MFNPFDDGYEQFKTQPDLLLVEVWRLAMAFADHDEAEAFVSGYQAARAKHDAYKAENQS